MRPRSLTRRRRLAAGLISIAFLAPVSATTAITAAGADTATLDTATADTATAEGRQAQYAAAAAEFGVPESVLLGVSYLESRWDTNAGSPSTSGGYGPMHLTDAEYVAALPTGTHHDGSAEDPRGDPSRPLTGAPAPEADVPDDPALQTLDAAASLTGSSADTLRTDPEANIRAGAALLAQYQAEIGATTGAHSDPAAWYGAVARYSGADVADAARAFADEVYTTMRDGVSRTTDDGHPVSLAAQPELVADQSWLAALGLRPADRPGDVECPRTISCEWIPSAYALKGDGTNPRNYGHHDLADRPRDIDIDYIVIHDIEGYFEPTLGLIQDVNWAASWQYTLRSSDGHIAQHLTSDDVAWQAGNWYINTKSIGLEHEGFAAQGTWYTEAMYRTSAKLVRYLADRFDIPLDRQHIIGHDNVQATGPAGVGGMHWDPGPYWDWNHYLELLRARTIDTGTPRTGLVTIKPDFAINQPAFTGCEVAGQPCPVRNSSSVILHSAPSEDSPLVTDLGLHPDGSPSTMHISDHGARASAGQQFAIADREGDWTAIWYLGQKAWFHNPRSAPTAEWSMGLVATPRPGKDDVPVYGVAWPDADEYPEGVAPRSFLPLQYTIGAGERYAVGPIQRSEYYKALTFDGSDPGDWTNITGDTRYVQVQLGHRIAFVKLDDVVLLPSAVGAPR